MKRGMKWSEELKDLCLCFPKNKEIVFIVRNLGYLKALKISLVGYIISYDSLCDIPHLWFLSLWILSLFSWLVQLNLCLFWLSFQKIKIALSFVDLSYWPFSLYFIYLLSDLKYFIPTANLGAYVCFSFSSFSRYKVMLFI